MRDDIRNEVLAAIRADFAFKRTKGHWLQQGKCPQCGKFELFARADNPWFVRCGRPEKCGWEQQTRERYPEIFDSWSKRHKQTEADPHAAADAFLSAGRHLDLRGLRGHYSQEWYQDRERGIGSATVRFPLPGGSWWERLIDNPGRFDRKARFAPGKSYSGNVWHRPDLTIAEFAAAKEIWFAEGIFNALALEQAGVRAASTMACYNFPETFLRELRAAIAASDAPGHRPLLVWAFDAGGAGERYTREFAERAAGEGWECAAAQPREEGDDGRDLDWNDLLIFDRLGPEKREQYRWNGDVLLAATAADKALLIHQRHRLSSFHLVFRSRTFWASYDAAAAEEQASEIIKAATGKLQDLSSERIAEIRADAARSCLVVEEIANCAFRVLYRQRDDATDETCYFLNIDFPSDRASVKGGFSATALTTAAEFKKRLFAIGTGAIWTGSQHQLDRIMQRQTPRIADVLPLGFTGYCRDTKAYVLGGIAVKDGRVHYPNGDDFFAIGKLAVKLGTSERLLDVTYDPDGIDVSWLDDLWAAYGAKGIVTLAFYFGTLFAEQVRAEQKSFPFFEMWGLPGSGKTTLVEFLWKLLGRENYEGFDPAKATAAAIARNLGKGGNLPVVLIEGDRRDEASHSKKFDWEELKTAYNGRSVHSRGVRNGGMETFEPPFRGSVIIEQNEPVNASRAINERIMSLGFDQQGWSEETKLAAQRLEQWPVEKLSGFIVHAARRETDVMARFRQSFAMHEQALLALPAIRTNRLAKTHGQLLAMLDALRAVLPALRADHHAAATALVGQMATQRQLVVESEHPDVAVFWERFDFLEEREAEATEHPINKHRDAKLIAISLGEFEARCADLRLSIPAHADLIKNLKTSKSRRFVSAGTVNTRSGKCMHCWVFERSAAERSAGA
jgi:hypothetical protein